MANHASAWSSRGVALQALDRHADAIASFDRAIALEPDFADAHFNKSLALLAIGDYPRGQTEYEWRWKRSGAEHLRQNFGRPLWRGDQPPQRKTILLHAEQGLGDTIQFARYARLLGRAGANVVLETHPELKPLLARLEGCRSVIARGEARPAHDFHCPLGSLPLAFKTELSSVPAEIPYLSADAGRIDRWRPRLETFGGPRVALVWAGNAAHANDRNRSVPLALLRSLWEGNAARVVSLQRDLRAGDAETLAAAPVLHLGPELADFDDTAAVLAGCDLLITVDTSVAHLAGAMGRPVWLLLPFSCDWRWTVQSDRSPWYPSVRLYRQPQPGDWESVVARVARDLPAAL
jgi:Tetratricopeptide repeat/Glycosyltransferase family 9 (heptosyltransferase)